MKRMFVVVAVLTAFLAVISAEVQAAPYYQGKTVRITVGFPQVEALTCGRGSLRAI